MIGKFYTWVFQLDGDSEDSVAANLQEALSDEKNLVGLNRHVRRFSFLVIVSLPISSQIRVV